MSTTKLGFIPIFIATIFLSCEKNETILLNDGKSFCPLHFRHYNETGSFEGCGIIFIPYFEPVFLAENDGTTMSLPLQKQNNPFVVASPEPNSLEYDYRAFHRTTPSFLLEWEFEKKEMGPGTRISLYSGKTTPNTFGNALPFLGQVLENIPRGASRVHDWQIFIQREIDGSYTLGYIANGNLTILQSDILDFANAFFSIENNNGKCVLKATLSTQGIPSAFSTETLNYPAIPNDYSLAFGFDNIEEAAEDCIERPVSIKLKRYRYQSASPAVNFEDDFTCNTIWVQ